MITKKAVIKSSLENASSALTTEPGSSTSATTASKICWNAIRTNKPRKASAWHNFYEQRRRTRTGSRNGRREKERNAVREGLYERRAASPEGEGFGPAGGGFYL